MTGGVVPIPDDNAEARVRRTLDCAAVLLERWGYKRVTVEDIARRAGIGKGTVYLHWKTKDDLFSAVLMRDALSVMAEVIGALRADPAEVRLSAIGRRQLLAVMAKPLYRAFYVRDRDVLGKLAGGCLALRAYYDNIRRVYENYFTILAQAELVRRDCECALVMSAMDAMATGLVMQWTDGLDPTSPAAARTAGDVLANTITRAFEPEELPPRGAVDEAARQVIELFNDFFDRQVAMLSASSTRSTSQ